MCFVTFFLWGRRQQRESQQQQKRVFGWKFSWNDSSLSSWEFIKSFPSQIYIVVIAQRNYHLLYWYAAFYDYWITSACMNLHIFCSLFTMNTNIWIVWLSFIWKKNYNISNNSNVLIFWHLSSLVKSTTLQICWFCFQPLSRNQKYLIRLCIKIYVNSFCLFHNYWYDE